MTDTILLGVSVVLLVFAAYSLVVYVRGRRRQHSAFSKKKW